jgi:GTP-binding protein
MSAARPKIADYPFTTLHPNLGVVQAGEYRFTIADVPGLIPGAAAGKGLGLQFLRHVERCSALLHVIDCATLEPGRDPVGDYRALLTELAAYPVPEGALPLTQRPQLIALNKIDVPDAKELAEFVRSDFEALGLPVFEISTATRVGLRELGFALGALVAEHRVAGETAPKRISLVPTGKTELHSIRVEGGDDHRVFRIIGSKPERWVAQTNFANDDAVAYLGERLAKLGIEDELLKLGARRGSTVIIGETDGVVFDWEPLVSSIAELAATELEEGRRTNQDRRREYHDMMDTRARGRAEREAVREAQTNTDQES